MPIKRYKAEQIVTLLRHSNVSTTERHYIKDVPENTLEAMKQLEALCNDCAKAEDSVRAN